MLSFWITVSMSVLALLIPSVRGNDVEISNLINVESKDFENIILESGWNDPNPEFVNGEIKVDSGRFFSKLKKEQGNDDDDLFFVKKGLYNASGITYIPLFAFILPTKADPGDGSTVDLANQAIFALFTILCMVSQFLIPVFLTGSRDPPGQSRSMGSLSFSSKISNPRNKILNFMGKDVTNEIGLDREACLQNIVCEAHRNPYKYEMIGLPFRTLFPFSEFRNGTEGIYSSAANYGKYELKSCQEKFKCFFNVLDLSMYFVEVLKYSRSHPKINLENDNDLKYLR